MATQYTTDIPFSSSHHQQAFKLLELPPELLALLESDNPPMYTHRLLPTTEANALCRLTVTSSAATETTPGYAILCHGEKRYQMRQKNTSNPILILQPSSTGPTEADDASTFIPVPSVTAIAKIEDTIELILQETNKAPPKVNKWHEKFAKSRIEKKG
jgi:sister chromatid cohesion protein DCC1